MSMSASGARARIEGQGQVTYPDGSVYVGSFRDDLAHGRGTITYPDASSYEGDWVDGVIQATGVARYANGLVLRGPVPQRPPARGRA